MRMRAKRCMWVVSMVFMLATVSWTMAGIFGPGPNTTVIPSSGQVFSIAITAPPDNSQVLMPPGTRTVEGSVAVGSVAGDPTNVIYVVDVSGSTENPSFNPFQDINGDGLIDSLDDCNGDGVNGSALDAECFGLIALNQSLGNVGNVEVGLVAFGAGAQIADMSPAAGGQSFAATPQADVDGNLVPDVEEVVRSIDTTFGGSTAAGVGLFTYQITPGFATSTDYDSAISAVNATFSSQPAGEKNLALFLSDGNPTSFSTSPGSPIDQAVLTGTVINTFAVGTIAPGSCAEGRPLRIIADLTEGVCVEVADPASLVTVLPGITPALLDRVEVDGAAVPVDALGNFSAEFVCPEAGLFTVTATAYANDPDSTHISADITLECIAEQGCGNGVIDPGEECGEPELPECPAGTICDGCVCIPEGTCTDVDGDGYSPEGGACGPVDCDDNPSDDPPICSQIACTPEDALVLPRKCGDPEAAGCACCIHPGATDFPGDGYDTDCDPTTPGWGTPSSTIVNASTHDARDLNTVFLLGPLGFILLWRRLRKK